MNEIEIFIEKLAKIEKNGNSTNLYYGDNIESEIRRHNLKEYLALTKRQKPDVMLLGEAPGYRGCRLTGIPFTCERNIADTKYFKNGNFKTINDADNLESEVSASVVWNEISTCKRDTLIWNIFPFHPHENNNIKTNRTPNSKELKEGKEILIELLTLFEIKKIIAIGRKSESQIRNLGFNYAYVRHPARGGAKVFIESLRKFI